MLQWWQNSDFSNQPGSRNSETAKSPSGMILLIYIVERYIKEGRLCWWNMSYQFHSNRMSLKAKSIILWIFSLVYQVTVQNWIMNNCFQHFVVECPTNLIAVWKGWNVSDKTSEQMNKATLMWSNGIIHIQSSGYCR